MDTKKMLLIVQDDFTNWIPSYPMKTRETWETNVVLTKISSSFTDAGKNLHRVSLLKLVKIHNGITTQAPPIAQNGTEWLKG